MSHGRRLASRACMLHPACGRTDVSLLFGREVGHGRAERRHATRTRRQRKAVGGQRDQSVDDLQVRTSGRVQRIRVSVRKWREQTDTHTLEWLSRRAAAAGSSEQRRRSAPRRRRSTSSIRCAGHRVPLVSPVLSFLAHLSIAAPLSLWCECCVSVCECAALIGPAESRWLTFSPRRWCSAVLDDSSRVKERLTHLDVCGHGQQRGNAAG